MIEVGRDGRDWINARLIINRGSKSSVTIAQHDRNVVGGRASVQKPEVQFPVAIEITCDYAD